MPPAFRRPLCPAWWWGPSARRWRRAPSCSSGCPRDVYTKQRKVPCQAWRRQGTFFYSRGGGGFPAKRTLQLKTHFSPICGLRTRPSPYWRTIWSTALHSPSPSCSRLGRWVSRIRFGDRLSVIRQAASVEA